jgi:hypothetical protein
MAFGASDNSRPLKIASKLVKYHFEVILRPIYGGIQKKIKRPTAGLPNRPLVRDSDSRTPLLKICI